MASALFVLDCKGKPLIYRTYRGDLAQDIPAVFQRRVIDEEDINVTPVFCEQGVVYTFVKHNDVFLLMCSTINTCPLLQVAFLRQCLAVFESYFKKVSEESIRDNFVIIYELLDEMCDFGYPQYTEEKVLKEYITQEGLISSFLQLNNDNLQAKALPAAVTGAGGATPWRMPGKHKYTKNEVLFDVVEKVSLLVSQEGETLSSEIEGSIRLNVRLSGMPELRVSVNDKLLLGSSSRQGKAVELEDIKLHQCVKLNSFETSRLIQFIPPDGKFVLMSYRLNKRIAPLVVVTSNVVRHGSSRVEIFCNAKTTWKKTGVATFVEILIPIPSDADSPEAWCSHGMICYTPELNALVWTLRNVSGKQEFSGRTQFHLPSVRSSDVTAKARLPIVVKFEIPYFVPSGFSIRYVKITEKSNYAALPWVRYLTTSGDYQIRMN